MRETRRGVQRAYLIHAGPPDTEGLDELQELLRTAGALTVGRASQSRDEPHPDTYLGKGRLEDLAEELKESEANLVVADDELTPRQERSLEKLLGKPVLDRTAVILDIFALHAGSAEGKLQVELAQLQYNLVRMRGLWTHLERLGGGIGTRGPGESQLETDRRLARDRISQVRRRLKKVQSNRTLMRTERSRSAVPSVALVGYTNAGKSSLMNAVTDGDLGTRDELFHTLDPITRQFEHHGKAYVMTDTVGFIRKLPHQLVDAFGATLEETLESDILLVVEDASESDSEALDRRLAVETTLDQIGASSMPRIRVLNKVDLLDEEARLNLTMSDPTALLVSAKTGEGVEAMLDAVAASIGTRLIEVKLAIPYTEGAALAELHRIAGDLEREDTPECVLVTARLAPDVAARWAQYAID